MKRFWEKVNVTGTSDDCWEWQASTNGKGYGYFWDGGRMVLAHRFVYELEIGPIPEGLTIDHLCRNLRCVNPKHLEPVTNAENILRGDSFSAREARQTHCVHGHEYTTANTYRRPNGARDCRVCINDRSIRKRAKAKALAATSPEQGK